MPSTRLLSALGRATGTRLCAVWLVALATLPFTAPFAAFDWSALVGGGDSRTTFTTATPLASHVQDDGADDTPASNARVQRLRSIRLCDLGPSTTAQSGDVAATRTTRPHPTTTSPPHGTSALVTILRL
jgi:hypothetical protein